MFLKDNKKSLNQKVYDNINPHVLSRWFIDDGGINGNHSHGIQFNTQSFTVEEANNLCSVLVQKYGFKAWVVIRKNNPVINISAINYTKFVEITQDYIVDSMKNKLRML